MFPAILRGREGRMNGHIIRYLALNGPSLIYSVAKDLASQSQTRVHYPTVNRRMHDLVRQAYLQKAGTRTTKAGIPADLYASTLRGDFAALAGMPESNGEAAIELSPREIRQIISSASIKEGSPFSLLQHILEEDQEAEDLVDIELVPEIIKGVRNGYLNLDALDEGVICSAFASLVARKVIDIVSSLGGSLHSDRSEEKHGRYIDVLMSCLEKTTGYSNYSEIGKQDNSRFSSDADIAKSQLKPLSRQWGNELKVFLKLHALRFG
jgi:hypothetical protein